MYNFNYENYGGIKMKKTKKSGWKNFFAVCYVVLMCIYLIHIIYSITGCGDSDGSGSNGSVSNGSGSNGSVSNGASSGSSRSSGGYEKILGMEKSAVDKMYGEPVERPEAMGGHGAYIYSDKFSVHYTENGIADYMELGIAGEAFGLKLGDNTDTVQKALDKYNFEFLSMDGSIEYENSEYFIFLTPNEIQLISEFSIGLKGASGNAGYAASSDDSDAYAESSDSIDYAVVLGMDKSDVDAYFGTPVADWGINLYQYSDLGVGYDDNNKAAMVIIGGKSGSGGQIMGLKIGDSIETVEKVLAEYGFSFSGTTPDSPDDYEYTGTDYFVIVRYNGYQKATMMSLSIQGF